MGQEAPQREGWPQEQAVSHHDWTRVSYVNGKQTFRCTTCPDNQHMRYEYDAEGSVV